MVIEELKKGAAYLCVIECRPEDEVHTDACKCRRLEFERARKIVRETLDEAQAALAAGEGLQTVRDRLLSIEDSMDGKLIGVCGRFRGRRVRLQETPDGGYLVHFTRLSEDGPQGTAAIRHRKHGKHLVVDTYISLSADAIEALFGAYTRVKKERFERTYTLAAGKEQADADAKGAASESQREVSAVREADPSRQP